MTVKIINAFMRKIATEKPGKVREFRDSALTGFVVRQQKSGFLTYYAVTVKGSARRGNRRVQKVRIGDHPAISPTEARQAAQELIAKAKLDVLPLEKTVERISLSHFLEDHYLPWAKHHLKDVSGQIGQLRRFKEWNNLFLDEIDRRLVEGWRNKRLAIGTKASTVNRNVVVIRAVLSKAVEWEFLVRHPLEGLKRLSIDRGQEPAVLSDDTRKALFRALDARDQLLQDERESANRWRSDRGYPTLPPLLHFGDHLTPIVLTACYTGMRRGEIFSLQWEDVDLEEAIIVARAENTKTSQTRKIPMNDELLWVFQRWQDQTDCSTGIVFRGKTGGKLDNIQTSWSGLCKNEALQGLKFKDFRSDFGSRLANNGVDLAVTQRLLGHSSPTVTMKYYVSIKESTMREAVCVGLR